MTLRGKTTIEIGPWPNGLNLRDQDKASMEVSPKQLRFIKNFDVLDSGVLQGRLGCRKVLAAAPIYTGTSIRLISSILQTNDLYVVIASFASPNSTFWYSKKPESTAAWTSIATAQTGSFSDAVQYNSVIYFVQAVGGAGTAQSRTSLSAGGWTVQANIPKGDQAFVVKDRMFVVDWAASKIYWSKATDPTIWAPPDGGNVLVSPGDGESITKVVFINNSIYIFKRNKTFLFTFATDPAVDGQLTPLSTIRGAHDALVYNNEIYLVNDQSVFKLVNNYFSDIALVLDVGTFAGLNDMFDPLTRIFVEDGYKLIIGPVNIVNTGQLFSHFVMNLHTGAWSGRFYDDIAIRPQADLQKKYLTWRDTANVNGSSVGNLYISTAGSGLLCYTRFKSKGLFEDQNTFDVNSSEHTISPEYSFSTHEIIPENSYGEWKRCHFIQGRWQINLDTFLDTIPVFNIALGPELFVTASVATMTQAVNFFTAEKEGKLIVNSFRFKSFILAFFKPVDDLGTVAAKDPDGNSQILIKNIQVIVSGNRQQISEAVNE